MTNPFLLIIVLFAMAGFITFLVIENMPGASKKEEEYLPDKSDLFEVAIKNFSFSPSVFSVKRGTEVSWVNEDGVVHNIKSAVFSSPDLKEGDVYKYRFDSPGIYEYFCEPHPFMKGQVVVE